MATLSTHKRALKLKRIVGDLSLEKVAAAQATRTASIKQLQRRGLAKVKSELEGGEVTQ